MINSAFDHSGAGKLSTHLCGRD